MNFEDYKFALANIEGKYSECFSNKFRLNNVKVPHHLVYCDTLTIKERYTNVDKLQAPVYNYLQDSINLPLTYQFKNQMEYNYVFIHELMHSTGHSSRLDRFHKNPFGCSFRPIEEVIADTGNMLFRRKLQLYSKTVDSYNLEYIQWYIQMHNISESQLKYCFDKAEEAVQYIERRLELKQMKKGELYECT